MNDIFEDLKAIYDTLEGKEAEFRSACAKLLHINFPDCVFVEEIDWVYDSNYFGRTTLPGIPKGIIDIFSYDPANDRFCIFELKLQKGNEIESGRYFGQLLNYKILFEGSFANDLAVRFMEKSTVKPEHVHGSIDGLAIRLNEIGGCKEFNDINDPRPTISEVSLIVCGGGNDYMRSPNCDILYSHFVDFNRILKPENCDFSIYHFTMDDEGARINSIVDLDDAGYFS